MEVIRILKAKNVKMMSTIQIIITGVQMKVKMKIMAQVLMFYNLLGGVVMAWISQLLSDPCQCMSDTREYVEKQFNPEETLSPKNISDSINKEKGSADFFTLFWDAYLWQLFVDETNRQAEHVGEAKPSN